MTARAWTSSLLALLLVVALATVDTPRALSKPSAVDPAGCKVVKRIVPIGLSSTAYPEIRAHWDHAISQGYPRILTVHRKGAAARRAKLLQGVPTAPRKDRDEYPPAMARATVKADVRLVDSGQNRSSGSVQGAKLRPYCSGQRFRIVWY